MTIALQNRDYLQEFDKAFDIWSAYNPVIIERLIPDTRMDKHQFYDSHVLVEPCPACGSGRTLFVHLAQDVSPVVEANFKHWCRPCRLKLAEMADGFASSLQK